VVNVVGGASGPAGRLDAHPRVAMHIFRHSKIAVTMEICCTKIENGRSPVGSGR
jgi:hypothetical protein